MELPFAESWKIKMVEPIRKSTREEREQWIKEAHYNVFQLRAEHVYIDLLTDSGTGSMTDRQWAGMMLGDESYAGASSFFNLKNMITRLTGFDYVIPTHQGRAAENVLFSYLVKVRAIADIYGKRVLFDSARFAENAYFIKTREEGYQNKTIKEIVKEMFDNADGMTMSAKKDAIVNMGGFIATRHQDWFEGAKGFCVQYEGYLTYGGMNGRDMNALAIGLDENTEFDNLETRIKQVEYLAKRLDEFGIPYQRPAGGHALFVDAPKVLTHVPKEEFPAQTLTVELYLEAGIRGCEIGYILADRDPVTRENRFGGLDLLRLAIPRRVYTNNHMDVIAVALKNVFDRREQITRGFQITWEAPLMRHFTVQLERAK